MREGDALPIHWICRIGAEQDSCLELEGMQRLDRTQRWWATTYPSPTAALRSDNVQSHFGAPIEIDVVEIERVGVRHSMRPSSRAKRTTSWMFASSTGSNRPHAK